MPQPVTYVEIHSPELEVTEQFLSSAFGWQAQPFDVPGVGRGCYITDPAGVLIGLHEHDPGA